MSYFGTTWLLTGSADEDITLWEVHQKTKHTITAHTKYRLEGMNAPITCVKYGKLEIVTADSLEGFLYGGQRQGQF